MEPIAQVKSNLS